MMVTLNIGLWINGKPNANLGPRTVLHEVINCLSPIDIIFLPSQRFAKSGEPTIVITMAANITADHLTRCVMQLCLLLNQDCIAGIADGVGFLIGPNTAPYGGKFNPEYFIAH